MQQVHLSMRRGDGPALKSYLPGLQGEALNVTVYVLVLLKKEDQVTSFGLQTLQAKDSHCLPPNSAAQILSPHDSMVYFVLSTLSNRKFRKFLSSLLRLSDTWSMANDKLNF